MIRAFLAALMLVSSTLMAEEMQKQTCLYFVSSEGEYIGQGETTFLTSREADFSTRITRGVIEVLVSVKDETDHDYWYLSFAAPEGTPLMLGHYENAERYPFNDSQPGLDVTGCGRGCNKLVGDFEVLELKYGEDGELEAFAANFTQGCERGDRVLQGNIRYNSSIPVEQLRAEIKDLDSELRARFAELQYPFLLIRSDDFGGGDAIGVEHESSVMLLPLRFGGNGVQICVDTPIGLWTFDFAAPGGAEFALGEYKFAQKYPFQDAKRPGIEVIDPYECFSKSGGKFEVLELARDENGEISKLALDFVVENQDDDLLYGFVRYKSTLPITSGSSSQR